MDQRRAYIEGGTVDVQHKKKKWRVPASITKSQTVIRVRELQNVWEHRYLLVRTMMTLRELGRATLPSTRSVATTFPPCIRLVYPRHDTTDHERTLRASEVVHPRVSAIYKPYSNMRSSSTCSNQVNVYAAAHSAPFTPSTLGSVKSMGVLSLNAPTRYTRSRST